MAMTFNESPRLLLQVVGCTALRAEGKMISECGFLKSVLKLAHSFAFLLCGGT